MSHLKIFVLLTLQAALNAYFESNSSPAPSSTAGAGAVAAADPPPPAATAAENDQQPQRIRLLSWNIDGLDGNNFKDRTLAVCKTIIALGHSF